VPQGSRHQPIPAAVPEINAPRILFPIQSEKCYFGIRYDPRILPHVAKTAAFAVASLLKN
jgi:hypothetical protein